MSVASSFTKEKLKAELKKINITAPKDSRKEVYVELYKKHILQEDRRQHSEFSSDDESRTSEIRRVPNKKKPGTPKGSFKQPMSNGTMEVGLLSDAELRSKLIAFGVNAGPITESTRRVYQKKLQRMLETGEKKKPAPQPAVPQFSASSIRQTEFSDQDDVEPEEEPSILSYSAAALRRRPMTQPPRMIPDRPTPTRMPYYIYNQEDEEEEDEEDDENYEDEPDYNPINGPFTATKPTTKAPVKNPTQGKKWRLSIWIQILIFLVVAILVYLLIHNMEPSQRSLIGNIGAGKAAGAN